MQMMGSALRRLTFDEPVSRLAALSKKLAKLSLALAALALVAGHAHGGLARFFAALTLSPDRKPSPGLGLYIFLLSLFVAALSLLVGLGGVASIWHYGRRGIGKLIGTLALLTLFIPYPAYLIYSAGNPPWIADISTDLDDPPVFSVAPEALAARNGWIPGAFDPSHRQEQSVAYSDVKPIVVEMDLDEAYNATREAVKQLRWTIIAETRPGGAKRPEGHIEALAHTNALNLPIAIAIRIRPGEDEARVDMRAATRYLPNDIGAGAALIGKLTDALEEKDEAE